MNNSEKIAVVNVYDYLNTERIKSIEDAFSRFKSNRNDDVENFLKNSAISFCRLKQSITYLLYNVNGDILAYFTLAFKILDLPVANMSNTLLHQVERFGQRKGNVVQLPCILLAQLSKNFALKNVTSGAALIKHVNDTFLQVQRLVGGSFAFVECEEEKKALIARYGEYGFRQVSTRTSTEGKGLSQLLKKI